MATLPLLIGFFLFVLAAVGAIGYFFFVRGQSAAATEPVTISLEEPPSGPKAVVMEVFHTVGSTMPASAASRDQTQRRLLYAGLRFPSALTVYTGAKWGVAGLLSLIGTLIAMKTQGDGSMAFAAAVCCFGFGFLLPERFLDARIKARNDRLRRALPPALDLMVMSLEAGQSVDQSMLLASRGLRSLMPDFAGELGQVHLETRASKSRSEALQHMSERVAEPEIRRFCTLLIESDRFGSSLAPTLRQHAKYLRVRFRQRAQEQARKLSVKMVFPIFFLIFPGILVVTLGPAVLTMMKYFKSLAN